MHFSSMMNCFARLMNWKIMGPIYHNVAGYRKSALLIRTSSTWQGSVIEILYTCTTIAGYMYDSTTVFRKTKSRFLTDSHCRDHLILLSQQIDYKSALAIFEKIQMIAAAKCSKILIRKLLSLIALLPITHYSCNASKNLLTFAFSISKLANY